MTLPVGYDTDALEARVIITDFADVEQFRWESAHLFPGGTRDFVLQGMILHLGINDDHGYVSLEIRDDDKSLQSTDGNFSSLFKRQWNIQVFLGKDTGNMQRWFYGKILEAEIIPVSEITGALVYKQRLFCGGWGVRLTERISSIRRFQAKQADGITLDDTDNAAKISEIFKDIIEDTDHYPLRSLGTESAIVAHVDDIDIKLAEFQESFQTWAHLMARCAANVGGHTVVDADRLAHLHRIISEDSGLLITNDVDNILTTNWDADKLMIIEPAGFSYKDSTINAGYSVLHAFGAIISEQDINQDPAVDAVFNMSTKYIAVEFTPGKNSLGKVAIKLQKTGNPLNIGDAFIKIVSLTGTPDPKEDDIIKRVAIPVEKLVALQAAVGTWVEIPFEKITLDTDRSYALVLEKYGDATDTIEWEYLTGVGGGTLQYWDSNDGIAWASQTGDFTIRTYPQRTINQMIVNTTALKRSGNIPRERIIPLRDFSDDNSIVDLLTAISSVMGKERRILPPILSSAPTDRIQMGTWARFVTKGGLDFKADIISADLNFDAFAENALGVEKIQLAVEAYR